LLGFDKKFSELQHFISDGEIMQEQHENPNSTAPQGWQKMLATLLRLNRAALEAKKEEEAKLKQKHEEAA